jgi:circadian clock protein KaiC
MTTHPRMTTGNPQADRILGGGFPTNSINIVMGQPGTGKTIFAEQLMFANATGDRPLLFVTTLSEPMTKVVSYAQRFAFFNVDILGSEIQYHDLAALLSSEGPRALVAWLTETIKTTSPKVIVIDSFRALHDLAISTPEMRRTVSDLAGVLSAYDTTAFFLGEYTRDDIPKYPEFAIGDSIVELARQPLGTRDERFFRVLKLRGSSYLEGEHAFRIGADGLEVYPRLVSPRIPTEYEPRLERLSTGVPGLDEMMGGGVWIGTSTLVIGPTGSGKTTLALQFALEGVRRGEQVLYVNFQENPAQLRRTLRTLDLASPDVLEKGMNLLYATPVELQIDSIVVEIFERIRGGAITRVVVDAIGDLAIGANNAQRLHDYLYALVQHFAVNEVTSLLTFESGTGGADMQERFSYMADNVLQLGLGGAERTRRTLRVIKTRNSEHDMAVHDLEIRPGGARIP